MTLEFGNDAIGHMANMLGGLETQDTVDKITVAGHDITLIQWLSRVGALIKPEGTVESDGDTVTAVTIYIDTDQALVTDTDISETVESGTMMITFLNLTFTS